jgi:hypothetical protein
MFRISMTSEAPSGGSGVAVALPRQKLLSRIPVKANGDFRLRPISNCDVTICSSDPEFYPSADLCELYLRRSKLFLHYLQHLNYLYIKSEHFLRTQSPTG